MAKIISNFKYIMILIAVGLVSGISTFAILSLPGVYRNIVTVFILPVGIAAIFTLIIFGVTRKLKMEGKKLAKVLGIIFLMAYVMLESIFVIFTVHTIESLVLLIPADLVIMALPLFALFRRGNKQEILEFNADLTSRLQSMVGPDAPEVYTRESIGNALGGNSNGEPWKIIIYKHTLENLNDEEVDMLMLELYYKKSLKTSRKIVFTSFSVITLLFDAYLAVFIVNMNVSLVYFPYLIGTDVVLLILTFGFPFILTRLIMKVNMSVDREIISHNGNRMALISLIHIENNREPGAMMTQRQYDRFKAKQKMNAKRRIDNLDSID